MIAFITPSVRSGGNGVFDYTVRLAKCLGSGNACIVKCESGASFSDETDNGIPVITTSPDDRQAGNRLTELGVDVISLQFSGYGYHPQGLAGEIGAFIERVRIGRHLQIMFHEIWIGIDQEASVKHRIWGALQRHSIVRLARRNKPNVVHTTNAAYQCALQQCGINARILPVFSNIPVLPASDNHGIEPLHQVCRLPEGKSFALLFGSIYPNIDHQRGPDYLRELSNCSDHDLRLVHVGHTPEESQTDLCRLAQNSGLTEPVFIGPRDAKTISMLMHTAQFGVSSNPMALIEKSGSAAAMREHDLPMLCVARDWEPRTGSVPTPPPRCFGLTTPPREFLAATQSVRYPNDDALRRVTKQLLHDLQ